MRSITTKAVGAVALLVEIASCSSIDESYDLEEGRTFGISNISLTITYVTFVVALVMLAGFLWITFAFSGAGSSSYATSRDFNSGFSDWMYAGGNRFKRSPKEMEDQDLAEKLTVLNDSFKKFDMESLGCQMLVSCESAQLETMEHPIYGKLTPKIHKLLSTTKSRDVQEIGNRIGKLRQAHREGRKEGTSCKKLYGYLCPDLDRKFPEEPDVILMPPKLPAPEEGRSKKYRSDDATDTAPQKSKFKYKSSTSEYTQKKKLYANKSKEIEKKYRGSYF